MNANIDMGRLNTGEWIVRVNVRDLTHSQAKTLWDVLHKALDPGQLADEPTYHYVRISNINEPYLSQKVWCIKALKEITGMGLKQAKDCVESILAGEKLLVEILAGSLKELKEFKNCFTFEVVPWLDAVAELDKERS